MALNKDALKSALETIFNEQADVPVHPHTDDGESKSFATLVCDAVDDYLADIETGGFSGNQTDGTNTGSVPSEKSEPTSPITADDFRAEFIKRCKAHYDDHEAQSFSSCAAKLQSDLQTFTEGEDSAGYVGVATTTAPNTLDLDAAFDKGIAGESHTAVAQEFADQIHAVTTGTTVVYGAYALGSFAGNGGGGNLE